MPAAENHTHTECRKNSSDGLWSSPPETLRDDLERQNSRFSHSLPPGIPEESLGLASADHPCHGRVANSPNCRIFRLWRRIRIPGNEGMQPKCRPRSGYEHSPRRFSPRLLQSWRAKTRCISKPDRHIAPSAQNALCRGKGMSMRTLMTLVFLTGLALLPGCHCCRCSEAYNGAIDDVADHCDFKRKLDDCYCERLDLTRWCMNRQCCPNCNRCR